MEVLRVHTGPAPDDDAHVGKLTARQEAFARAWVETGNQSAAYRKAYSVAERTLPNSVWAAASAIAALPQVRARYKELSEQAALETIMSARELLQMYVDIATADPNELTRVVLRNCRYCRGHEHRYQWKDEDEYIAECAKLAEDEDATMPSDAGGYGFNGALEPVPTCSHCFGQGIATEVICDTTKLEGKARRLYAGSECDRFGVIKIKMRDQDKAGEMVGRMLGVFKEALDIRTPGEKGDGTLPAGVTADQAAKAYLALIQGKTSA